MNEYKQCNKCGRYMSVRYEPDTCPICQEIGLFGEVRDYIRENNVNAFEVADKFGIPLEKVKTWIKCGKIEYRSRASKKEEYFCLKCGKVLFNGCYCKECEAEATQLIGMEYKKIMETGILTNTSRRRLM